MPDDPPFHVTPFQHRPNDGPRVIFLVSQPGMLREVAVERKDGFYEFIADGGAGTYDPEIESPALTAHLMDVTDAVLLEADALQQRIDDNVAAHRMYHFSDKQRVH